MPGTHCVGRSVSQHEADCFPAGSEWADIGHFEIDADLIFFCGCDFLLLPQYMLKNSQSRMTDFAWRGWVGQGEDTGCSQGSQNGGFIGKFQFKTMQELNGPTDVQVAKTQP